MSTKRRSGGSASGAAEASVGTDAPFAPQDSARPRRRRTLRNVSEVRHFFRTNDVPIYFVGATPFNLLGLDRWVRNLWYVTYNHSCRHAAHDHRLEIKFIRPILLFRNSLTKK